MKKLLFLFDTDPFVSVFDTVVAYDGGADRVTLRALTEQAVGSRAASLDFPERTALGLLEIIHHDHGPRPVLG